MKSLLVLLGLVYLVGLLVSRSCNEDCRNPCFDPRPSEEVLGPGYLARLGNTRALVGQAYWGWVDLDIFTRPGGHRYVTVRKGSVFEAGGSAWRVTDVQNGVHGGIAVERAGPCTTPIGCDEEPRSRSRDR
jgi:hypothetical protein